jgi:hypothetical protein
MRTVKLLIIRGKYLYREDRVNNYLTFQIKRGKHNGWINRIKE